MSDMIVIVLHIDASLDWMQVNAGQVLWRPQDASDSFYIVINGRLRAITESEDGAVAIVGEYGQGDTVGELDVITSSPRRNTVHAIRDTELIRMPQTLFNAISARCVSFAFHQAMCSFNLQGTPKQLHSKYLSYAISQYIKTYITDCYA